MDLNDKIYVDINNKYIYCNSNCKYEDSVGFCKFLKIKHKTIPEDAKCYGKTWFTPYSPRDLIPDDYCIIKFLREEYGFR